jgi:N-acyl-D-aspartate/D-glutamate deacylase
LLVKLVHKLLCAAEGQDPLAVIHDIMSRDLKPELDTMVLAAAAQKSAAM